MVDHSSEENKAKLVPKSGSQFIQALNMAMSQAPIQQLSYPVLQDFGGGVAGAGGTP